MNNEWIYFALHPVTTLWEKRNLLICKLRINSGCKTFTNSVLLKASCAAMSGLTIKGGDLLTQNCTGVTAVKNCVCSLMLVNCVQMWSAGKRRLILKIWNVLTLRYRVWKGNCSRRMEKPPDSQTQHTLCGSIYPFYYCWILCPYKQSTSTKRSGWNRRVLESVSGSSVETQVSAAAGGTADTETMTF